MSRACVAAGSRACRPGYGSSSTFPTSSYNAANYWVDVVFTTQATAPDAPGSVTATAGDGSATVSWTVPANGGSPITGYTVTPYVGTTAGTPVTVSGSPPATTATVSGLTNGTAYTFRVAATNAVSAPTSATTSEALGASAKRVAERTMR